MRDGMRAFFQIQGIFHYFRAFKTKILHIYSPYLFSVLVTSGGYLPRRSMAG